MEHTLSAGDLLDAAHGESPAIEFEGEAWSYAELDRRANRFAHWFRIIGLQPGDRVSLLVGNEPALVAAYFGAFRAGLIANPINTRLTAPEIAYVVNHAGSACVIVSADLMPGFDATRPLLEGAPHVLALADGAAVAACDDGPLGISAPNPHDGALLLYTSGTTGKPKGVLLTHGNLVAATRIVAHAFEMSSDDRTMCVMPLFHTNALMFSHLPFMFRGATVLLRRRFSATTFWSDCRASHANSASTSPTILALLLAHEDKGPPCGETGLKYIKVASAPTPVELAERFEARFGERLLLETFGLTETTAITTMNPLHGARKFGSIGQVVPPQELRIVDDEGRPMQAEQPGEIAIAGPTVMREYFRDPENTRRAMSGRWFRSGDLGRMDADGFVFIVGRKKEMILRGGENISPLEIEQIAEMHPGVREAAAVGLPDAIWGEVVGLCVVRDAPLAPDEIVAFCRGHLSAFKVPQRIAFVEALPRNAMGKVVRGRLREMFDREPDEAAAAGTEGART